MPWLVYQPGWLLPAMLLRWRCLNPFLYGCVYLRIKSWNHSGEDIEHVRLLHHHELVMFGDHRDALHHSLSVSLSLLSLCLLHTHSLLPCLFKMPPLYFWSSCSCSPDPLPTTCTFYTQGLALWRACTSIPSTQMLPT